MDSDTHEEIPTVDRDTFLEQYKDCNQSHRSSSLSKHKSRKFLFTNTLNVGD